MVFLGDSTLTELETVGRVVFYRLSNDHGEIQPSQLPRHSFQPFQRHTTDEIHHLTHADVYLTGVLDYHDV